MASTAGAALHIPALIPTASAALTLTAALVAPEEASAASINRPQRPRRVDQLEAVLVLLVEVGVLIGHAHRAGELRVVLVGVPAVLIRVAGPVADLACENRDISDTCVKFVTCFLFT